ncbi:hypothetical protein AVEN_109862-1 [Araneus ventricosus]|uniref:Uncharacterized protein n=1 Tax=Araneus ventricosus TaxID=182803 RepID=A0A4Y2PJM8_ARAVE|nr:hypothetical protein AVEN_109862-1 [Araneus ventricosus]
MAIQNSNLPLSSVNEAVKIVEDETVVRSNLKSVSDVYPWIKEYGRTSDTKWNLRSSRTSLCADDEDDTWSGTPSPNFHTIPTGGRLATTYDLACSRPHTRKWNQWNRVSGLEPSGPKAEALPLGHRGPCLYR